MVCFCFKTTILSIHLITFIGGTLLIIGIGSGNARALIRRRRPPRSARRGLHAPLELVRHKRMHAPLETRTATRVSKTYTMVRYWATSTLLAHGQTVSSSSSTSLQSRPYPPFNPGSCVLAANLTTAISHCSAMGRRLCTQSEVRDMQVCSSSSS